MICVWPRVKSAEPCVRGLTALAETGRISSSERLVRTPLVDRDLLADEVLVDRVERALDVLLRRRVLDDRLALDGLPADRERQLELLEDAVQEEVAPPT